MKRPIIILSMLVCAMGICAQEQATAKINKSLAIYTDVMRQLDVNYVDTLDYDNLTQASIAELLRRIDPYTVYIPKEQDENLKMMTTGKYGGIGAIIMQHDSAVWISEPYEGMPAAENDVLAGDKILEVDGFKCDGKTTKDVSDHLRGKAGTIVKLVLEREGVKEHLVREFERREIHLPAVSYFTTLDDTIAQRPTGYILFSEFTTNSAQDFLVAVEKMVKEDKIEQLVIDLRSNGGGLIDEAINIVGMFVDKGTDVVSTKGKTQASNRVYTTQISPIFKDLPLVILVDGHTASAAEIVSGSLQDFHRAKLVGQRTFGKGLVQSIRPVAFDGHIKVTTAHYYLPSGRCIQAIDYAERQKGKELKRDSLGGILPDIVLNDSAKMSIAVALFRDRMYFDYSVRYHAQHKEIARPEEFELTDEELEEFIQFLNEKNYKYETETSKYFKDVIDMARHEDIDSTTLKSIEDMRDQLTQSYREAIIRNKQEVKRSLSEEIIERYYFQRGRIAYLIRFDKELREAVKAF